MKTAISEMLMEKTVKPISLAPLKSRGKGLTPLLEMARDVLHHHDGVVHHEAGRNRQGHQRKVVDAVAEEIHHGESADQRDGYGNAGDEGGAGACAERGTRRR